MALTKISGMTLSEQLTVKSADGITSGRVNLPTSRIGTHSINGSGQHAIRLPQGTILSITHMGTGAAKVIGWKTNGSGGYITLASLTSGQSAVVPVWRDDALPVIWIESTDLVGEIKITLQTTAL